MSLGLLFVILGLAIGVLLHWGLGVLCVVVGLVLLVLEHYPAGRV